MAGLFALPSTNGNLWGLASIADGRFVVLYDQGAGTPLAWQRFNALGAPVGAPVEVLSATSGGNARLAANPAGRLVVGWTVRNPHASNGATSVLAQLWNLDGTAVAPPVTVAASVPDGPYLVATPLVDYVAIDLLGRATVTYDTVNPPYTPYLVSSLTLQRIDASGALDGSPLSIGPQDQDAEQMELLDSEENGNLTVMWTNDASFTLQRFTTAACSPSPASLCLDGNRFRFDVQFTDPNTGASGTGALWFFDPAVPELVAKVIDGTSLNGHSWVFFASLSNVAFDLTVTDTTTGATHTYHNPAGTLASAADIEAF